MRRPLARHTPPESPPAAAPADGGVRGNLRFLLVLAVLAWVVRSLIFAPFSIPSGSMLPTLNIGDYLVVAKWPYGYSRASFPFGIPSFDGRVAQNLPQRGDVAVFRHPTDGTDLIKRVIGLPGDTIEVRSGGLILNGKPVERRPAAPFAMPLSPNSPCKVVPPAEPRRTPNGKQCLYSAFTETLPSGRSYTVLDQVNSGPADDFGPVQVPADHVFLMGDNRDDSLDSRFGPEVGGIGFVPLDRLVGRAAVTFWSTDGSANYLLPWTWVSALRGSRIGNTYWTQAR